MRKHSFSYFFLPLHEIGLGFLATRMKYYGLFGLVRLAVVGCLLTSACSRPNSGDEADRLNNIAYGYHYRNLDSSMIYAQRAYDKAQNYSEGEAEALNNMAFVYTAKMNYDKAKELLDKVETSTNNQVELLVADVQQMRLCQRKSANKDFYQYRQRALTRIKRIEEERYVLTEHQNKRFIYALSEYQIVASTYFYYVGLTNLSVEAIENIDPNGEIVEDTAQLLNYYYNVGAGGIIKGNRESVCQTEFNYLMRCYLLSRQYGYPYWEANSLQALSEHLQDEQDRLFLITNNPQEIGFINIDKMPDSLLAGNIARRSLLLFERFGDTYQIAGAYRTLAECYWKIRDYNSALLCLNAALNKNKVVENAPDLVASIREQLSLTYSALGDMANAHQNRRIYLNMQEITRQDRQLEARAEQLSQSSKMLNFMIVAVVAMIVIVIVLLIVFDTMRRRNDKKYSVEDLLQPLEKWKMKNEEENKRIDEEFEETEEKRNILRQQLSDNKLRNVEQRAKISLAGSIIPFINRMEHEVKKLAYASEEEQVRAERYEYVAELTDKINEYNNILTRWIQLRQGELNLHIESFGLNTLFDMVDKSRMEYRLKGINFVVEKTDDVVKADKVLTLFMINTIAENARRHTQKGGNVMLKSTSTDEYVEVSISDTGEGIAPERLKNIFTHKRFESNENDSELPNDVNRRSHGFGLMNCKGIIDKYRKISSLFKVCEIGAESTVGEGSRFFFRLPKGGLRALIILLSMLPTTLFAATVEADSTFLRAARAYADSASRCNKAGQYECTINFADSCISSLNNHYQTVQEHGKDFMRLYEDSDSTVAELKWFYKQVPTDYQVVLNIRNEVAFAAMALHHWDWYEYNNKVYTKLFRERSADTTLPDYINMMQKSDTNKNVAIVILVCLFILIIPAYYFLYYRHRIYYNLCIHNLDTINKVLLSDITPQMKLRQIDNIWEKRDRLSAVSTIIRPIQDIVEQIKAVLQDSIKHYESQQESLELAHDELRKTEYENNNVYVSNNVLDNCLSTLKHETMYYPSRIKQLIDGKDENIAALVELVGYYKELYTILNEQALRQISSIKQVDYELLKYLFEVLRKLNGGEKYALEATELPNNYVSVRIKMHRLLLTAEQKTELFTPSTIDLRFLVCKQIIREVGDITYARGCGMRAIDDTEKDTIIEIILTNAVWKSLKL